MENDMILGWISNWIHFGCGQRFPMEWGFPVIYMIMKMGMSIKYDMHN
jgi:hypothetical protein